MDFGGLAVGVSRGDALAEGFQAAHLRFDPTSGVIARPAFPEGPAIVSGGAQGFVPVARRRAVLLPQTSVSADRNDRDSITPDDGLVAAARVIGAIGGDGADLLAYRDLAQHVWQHGAVAVAAGSELHGADSVEDRSLGESPLAEPRLAQHQWRRLGWLPFGRQERQGTERG